MMQLKPTAMNGTRRALRSTDPVFVLCMGRSGSTLLRLILDTHPDLACPPETSLPAMCAQLAVVWSLIEGAPLSPTRGDAPPAIPDAAIAGIRHTMDMMTSSYLARRGKRVFCEKSLSSARFAELLTRIYPGARFVCLFRHPMDMISSGIEACPWGLNGYGFDQYIAGSPGNAVLALARYWHDEAHAITAVEDKHSDKCYRVRYEDLVEDPERVAAGIFDFIGVKRVPGISQAIFTPGHERLGPADHKIWHTSRIGADSVGRGEAVPAGLIPPPILDAINGLLDQLGYVRVDESWGTADMPAGVRMPDPAARDIGAPSAIEAIPEMTAFGDRLQDRLARADGAFATRWQARMAETFTVAVRQPLGAAAARWHVDLATQTLTTDSRAEGNLPEHGAEDEAADWSIVGTVQAWEAILAGRLNMSVALRRNELRYCDLDENDISVTDARVAMFAELLGLTSWGHDRETDPTAQALAMADPQ